MDKVLESLVVNGPGIVGVIIVVVMFLRFQKGNLEQVKQISADCHQRTADDRASFQAHIDSIVSKQEKMADSYYQGMLKFAESIGKNGEILTRMENALVHMHRRSTDPRD